MNIEEFLQEYDAACRTFPPRVLDFGDICHNVQHPERTLDYVCPIVAVAAYRVSVAETKDAASNWIVQNGQGNWIHAARYLEMNPAEAEHLVDAVDSVSNEDLKQRILDVATPYLRGRYHSETGFDGLKGP